MFLKTIRDRLSDVLNETYATKSYSQEGEDVLLNSMLGRKKNKGYYVDIGAHHPKRFSNTYLFYKIGWVGINIDATPGSMVPFKKIRPKDINLESAVSDNSNPLTFYMFNEPALNSFNKKLSTERDGLRQYKIINTAEITPVPLSEILDQHLPADQKIDFFTIDAEGFDLNVLKSNNWSKYRPEYILVECDARGDDIHEVFKDPILIYLEEQGYSFCAKTMRTTFFKNLS